MTILTAGSCTWIATTSGNAVPAVIASALGLATAGVKLFVQSKPLNIAIGAALGAGSSTGAIAAAAITKTYTAGLSGAVAGVLSSAAASSVFAGCYGATTGVLSSSPLGLLTVGTDINERGISFDCWKQVVRDMSKEPSNGIALRDLVSHKNVKNFEVSPCGLLSQVTIENIWDERFELQYIALDGYDKLLCHVISI